MCAPANPIQRLPTTLDLIPRLLMPHLTMPPMDEEEEKREMEVAVWVLWQLFGVEGDMVSDGLQSLGTYVCLLWHGWQDTQIMFHVIPSIHCHKFMSVARTEDKGQTCKVGPEEGHPQ